MTDQSPQCQHCAAKAQTWLCSHCESELRSLLRDLPWWIDRLVEKVLGQTREGESARHSTDLTSPMPVNLTASGHLDTIHAMLVGWVRDLCESRGASYVRPRMVPRDFIGPLPENSARGHADHNETRSAAIWLSKNTGAIACDEAAGMCFDEIQNARMLIEAVINRPVPPRDLGPCPTQVNADQCRNTEPHHHPHACATRLSASRRATEVRCPQCKTVHQVDHLVKLLQQYLLYEPLSAVEIIGSRTSELPGALDYWNVHASRSTFYEWRKKSLITRAYRNPKTLVVMPEREDSKDEPLFWLADVLDRLGVEWRTEKAG